MIYAGRGVVITAFLFAEKTTVTVLAFSAAMGLLWLSTVPPTVALCARNYGTRWLATIFGLVFLGHQIGGFTGAYLGGIVLDRTGSYDLMWTISILAAAFAALIHLPVRDGPRAPMVAADGLTSQGRAARRLQRLQHEGAPRFLDAGHAEQRLQRELGIGLEIRRRHVEQVVHLAAHGIGGEHLRPHRQGGLEPRHHLLGMAVERHQDEGLQGQPEPRVVEHGGVAGDHPLLLQPPQPALAGRRRQADLLGQRHHREAPVPPQRAQDAPVGGVQLGSGFRRLPGHA